MQMLFSHQADVPISNLISNITILLSESITFIILATLLNIRFVLYLERHREIKHQV